MEITEKQQLEEIGQAMHDYWFDVDAMVYSKEAKTVKICFYTDSKKREGLLLTVNNVLACLINDTEQIGMYDLNHFEYDEKHGELRFITCIPLGLTLRVSSLAITVDGSQCQQTDP